MYQPNYDDIMKTTETPAYVFDIDDVRNRIIKIKAMLGKNIDICYAMKANPFLVAHMIDVIDKYEVCSPGEFKICERADIPIRKIVLSGVYKEEQDTKRIIETYQDKITYTCESQRQFHMINDIAESLHIKVNVLLRVTTGNQFGMDENDICELVNARKTYQGVEIIGLQHFSGTQRKRISKYKEELQLMDSLLEKLDINYGYKAKELEFGPGFYVEYFQNAKPYEEEVLLEEFKSILDNLKFKGHITLELGRFLVAACGTYYTKIVDKKKNKDNHYCIVDGGMHQIVYYGQMMAMKLPEYRQLSKYDTETEIEKCNISGSLCTINDNIVKELPLKSPHIGDILEFKNTGAYSMCEGISLFLSRDLPKIYVYTKKDKLVLMRDTFETNVLNYKSS